MDIVMPDHIHWHTQIR